MRESVSFLCKACITAKNAHTPWILLGRTTGVGHAEVMMKKYGMTHTIGHFIYLESKDLPTTVWDLRAMKFRTFDRRLAKTVDGSWKKIRKHGRMIWIRDNPHQMKML